MGPIDYTGQVANPFASALQGYQIGTAFQQMEAQKAAQQQAMMIAQQEAEQRRAINDRLNALGSNPNTTLKDYISVANLLPEKQAESLRKNWELLDKTQQHSELTFTTQVLSAMNSGQTGIGVQMLNDRADSEKDPAKAKVLRDYARLAELSPAQATKTMAVMVGALPEGAKVLEGLSKAGTEERAVAEEGRKAKLFPSALTKAESEAQSAAVAAKFAESKAVADLKLTETQTKAIGEDLAIKRQNAAIAAASVAASREGNAIKRQEALLKLEELKDKRDQTVRDKVGEVEAARFNIDNMLNTADRVLKTPKSVIGSAAGPISARIPTMSQDTADFEALVETLGSQAFLSQLPNIKGMGQLSNAEGEKLQAALQNLSLKQSPERLVENVKEAQRLLLKVRGGLTKRYGVPDSVPDTPEAATARPMAPGGKSRSVDDLVKQYGG